MRTTTTSLQGRQPSELWITVFLVTVYIGVTQVAGDCGGYLYVDGTGEISSPNYPSAYGNYSFCIWLLEAPEEHRVLLSIQTFEGQTYNGSCADYLEIRDGSRSSNLVLNRTCDTFESIQVRSTARWLWVLFRSDGAESTGGFMALFTSEHVGAVINNYSDPVVACKSFEFYCTNKECLSVSYRCDGVNDCGCNVDCDEDACDALDFEAIAGIAMGIGIGFAIFGAIFIFTFVFEQLRMRRLRREDPEAGEQLKQDTKKTDKSKQKKGEKGVSVT